MLKVQMDKGNFAPTAVSVGDLFAGAFIPGLMLVAFYLLWVIFQAIKNPASCPALVDESENKTSLLKEVFTSLLPPLLLIMAVLGSILAGIATPTESAAVGAVGAIILSALKRKLTYQSLKECMAATANTTTMVFVVLLGASVFSLVFRMLGGDELVSNFLANLPGGTLGAIIFVMLLIFLLGFILDTFEIIFIVLPITAPILLMMDVNPIWLGVIVAVNLQTSFLTPPFGFSLFYLRGVAPPSVTTTQIYAGVLPFVILQILAIGTLIAFPEIITWLPSKLYN